MRRVIARAALVGAALALAAGACGGAATTNHAGVAPTTSSTGAPSRPVQLVDRLVRVDGGRLHIRCNGRGAATVVLVAGWDGGDGSWGAIEPAVARRARVCSYAKFGTGASDAASTTQTFATQADDLFELLRVAGEPGPYVVLGHSFGGAQAVTFASKHRNEVIGLLLLDASPTTWPVTVCAVPAYRTVCDLMHQPANDAERLDVIPAFEQVAAITSLGNVPMTVMTGAHRDPTGLEPAEVARLDARWADGQRHWATLSSSSRVVTVEHTGHHIEVDQPALVIDELLRLVP